MFATLELVATILSLDKKIASKEANSNSCVRAECYFLKFLKKDRI
jgi:hypothetical protein